MDKQELRARMRAMRRALSQEEQEAASLAVHERLRCFAPYRELWVLIVLCWMLLAAAIALAVLMPQTAWRIGPSACIVKA